MFERIKIKFLRHQPAAKISSLTLDRLIQREYPDIYKEIRNKLDLIHSDTINGKNRFSAAILKLSNGDRNLIDDLIHICNNDFRDIVSKAEYPRVSKLSFSEMEKTPPKKLREYYKADWIDYLKWINKK